MYDEEQAVLYTSDTLDFCNSVDVCSFQGTSARLANLCRICGQAVALGIEIFTAEESALQLREKINCYTPITINSEDRMPQKICPGCRDKLETTHLLVVDCLRTDMRFRKILNVSSDGTIYHPRFEKLIAECSLEIAEETSLYDAVDTADVASANTRKMENMENAESENAEICPIGADEPTNENLKYSVNSDLSHLLRALGATDLETGAGDEVNVRMPVAIEEQNEEIQRSRGPAQLVPPNCDDSFQTRDAYENHRFLCNITAEAATSKEIPELEPTVVVVCTICGLAFVSVEYLEEHKKVSCNETASRLDRQQLSSSSSSSGDEKIPTKSANRRCGYCLEAFDNRKLLQSHMNEFHDGQQSLYGCGVCGKTYEKWSSLDVHEATHRADKPYLCDLCGKSFKHSNNLRGHKRIHLDEAKKKRHVCEVCGSAFRSGFHLREHANHHSGTKPYTCETCGKAFYKRIQLRQHRLSHGTNKYACPICSVTFNRRGNMNMHVKRHEKNDGTYTCSVCEYKCDSMSELRTHRKQHTQSDITESIILKSANRKIWRCSVCDKVFPKRAILEKHERTHSVGDDSNKIECDKCGKKLANKSSLRYHARSKHSTERPHMCQYCGEAFVSKEARLIHERIHTGERPYSCKVCGMRYRCSSNLSQHAKVHSATRPHVCQYCSKAFSRKGALRVHERIHTGVKPYACEICTRSFSQKNDMLKHTKTHRVASLERDEYVKSSV